MRIGILSIFVFSAAMAQQKPEAAEVLRRVTGVYSNATQYQLAVEETIVITRVTDGAVTSQSNEEVAMAVKQPDRVRFEIEGDMDDAGLVVSDGQTAWAYSPKANEYMKLKPGRAPAEPLSDTDVTDELKVPYMMQLAQRALEFFKFPLRTKGSVVGEETLTVKGSAYPCIVISVEDRPFPKSATKLWIDKTRNVVLREEVRNVSGLMIESTSAIYSIVRINEPLPEELFQFSPPPGARLVDDIGH
jgi:outer membrane lipoprotein-sorting protein